MPEKSNEAYIKFTNHELEMILGAIESYAKYAIRTFQELEKSGNLPKGEIDRLYLFTKQEATLAKSIIEKIRNVAKRRASEVGKEKDELLKKILKEKEEKKDAKGEDSTTEGLSHN